MGCFGSKDRQDQFPQRHYERRQNFDKIDKTNVTKQNEKEDHLEMNLIQQSRIRKYMETKGLTNSVINAKKKMH